MGSEEAKAAAVIDGLSRVPSWQQKLRDRLIVEEGVRRYPYVDTNGQLTIGVGHNLTAKGVSQHIVEEMLDEDIADAVKDLDRQLPWWRQLNEARQIVMADMCFNIGIGGLLQFKKFLAAMEAGRFEDAAKEMQDSRWSHQVGNRARRLFLMVQTGKDA